MKDETSAPTILGERIAVLIVVLRGQKVLLDSDLATLYGVETRVLVQSVKRNLDRFPADFMFQLENQDLAHLKSQIVISRRAGHGGRRTSPYAFTEQGVAMLSSVLNSPGAIAVNIEIVRAFVRLREALVSNQDLARRLEGLELQMERKFENHDQAIAGILHAIRELMKPEKAVRRSIGFVQDGAGTNG